MTLEKLWRNIMRNNLVAKSALKYIAGVFLAVGLIASGRAAQAAENVVISGSTTVLPIMQKAGEAFMNEHPDIILSISGGGSGTGIKGLAEKLCQVAMSSRDIKPSEVQDAEKKGVKPMRTTVALDALAPVVHPSNPVTDLTLEQLKDIYAGKITNWKDVGGKEGNIVIVSRDNASGTFETWEDLVMKKKRITPRALLQSSNGGVVQVVARNKQSIGYIGFGYLNDQVKKVSVGGVEANAAHALDKTWPISRELYVFTDGQPKGATQDLIEYLVDPEKGQKAVASVGFIPLSGK